MGVTPGELAAADEQYPDTHQHYCYQKHAQGQEEGLHFHGQDKSAGALPVQI